MQSAPKSAAWRTPVHGAAGWGGRHRRSPTGGAAKGIPLKEATPSATTPCNWPVSTFTTGGVCVCATVPIPTAAANADSEQTSSLVTLEVVLIPSSRPARMPHPQLLKLFPYFPKDREIAVMAFVALLQPA
jgi:hypothetical protein